MLTMAWLKPGLKLKAQDSKLQGLESKKATALETRHCRLGTRLSGLFIQP